MLRWGRAMTSSIDDKDKHHPLRNMGNIREVSILHIRDERKKLEQQKLVSRVWKIFTWLDLEIIDLKQIVSKILTNSPDALTKTWAFILTTLRFLTLWTFDNFTRMLLDAFFIEDKISLTLIGLEEKEDWTLLEWETEINETMLIIKKMTGQVSELRASKIGAPKKY